MKHDYKRVFTKNDHARALIQDLLESGWSIVKRNKGDVELIRPVKETVK